MSLRWWLGLTVAIVLVVGVVTGVVVTNTQNLIRTGPHPRYGSTSSQALTASDVGSPWLPTTGLS